MKQDIEQRLRLGVERCEVELLDEVGVPVPPEALRGSPAEVRARLAEAARRWGSAG